MQMGNISESYSVLSKDCLQSGHRIFEVGRYLDKTRSDLVRGCSEITQQDWMRVFEVDHYVLTWRVYNNIVGFEHLQKKQVDNPAGHDLRVRRTERGTSFCNTVMAGKGRRQYRKSTGVF